MARLLLLLAATSIALVVGQGVAAPPPNLASQVVTYMALILCGIAVALLAVDLCYQYIKSKSKKAIPTADSAPRAVTRVKSIDLGDGGNGPIISLES